MTLHVPGGEVGGVVGMAVPQLHRFSTVRAVYRRAGRAQARKVMYINISSFVGSITRRHPNLNHGQIYFPVFMVR